MHYHVNKGPTPLYQVDNTTQALKDSRYLNKISGERRGARLETKQYNWSRCDTTYCYVQTYKEYVTQLTAEDEADLEVIEVATKKVEELLRLGFGTSEIEIHVGLAGGLVIMDEENGRTYDVSIVLRQELQQEEAK